MFELVAILPPLIRPIVARPVALENYEHYLISYWGGVLINSKTNNVVKGWLNEQRYRRTKLVNGELYSNQYFQRLVALTWIANPLNKSDVNHVDRFRDNNSVPNLGWLTHAENMAYISCEPWVEQLEETPF